MHEPTFPLRRCLAAALLGPLFAFAPVAAQAPAPKPTAPAAPAEPAAPAVAVTTPAAEPSPRAKALDLLATARLRYEEAVERERVRALAAWEADDKVEGRAKQDRLLKFRATGEWPSPALGMKLEQAYRRERITLDAAYERCLDALLTLDEALALRLRAEMDRWATTEDRHPWIQLGEDVLAKLGAPVAAEASASPASATNAAGPDDTPRVPLVLPLELPESYRLDLAGEATGDEPLFLQIPTSKGARRLRVATAEGRFRVLVTVHGDGFVALDLGSPHGESEEKPAGDIQQAYLVGAHGRITHLRWKAAAPPCEPIAAPRPDQPKPAPGGKPDQGKNPEKPKEAAPDKPAAAGKAKRHNEPAEAATGTWKIEGDEIVAGPGHAELVFGDPEWTDYDLTLEAKATGDGNGFQIWVMRKPNGDHVAFSAGAQNNRTHRLLRMPKKELHRIINGRIDRDRYYKVEIKVRSGEVTVILDGREILRGTNDMWKKGRIGLFSQGSEPRFRNIRVTSPDGRKVLWEGLPSHIK